MACAALAFVLATNGGGPVDVVVDGGDAISAASDVPSASGGASIDDVIVVEVVGAVARPGVFRLPAGSRVADLVSAAGGYGPRVDTARAERSLNLAGALRDGDQVRVPSRDDEPEPPTGIESGGGTVGPPGPIDLNRATAEQLDTLPGIGPVTVEKILAAREEAPFATTEDLRTRGILGEKTFERIRDAIAVP